MRLKLFILVFCLSISINYGQTDTETIEKTIGDPSGFVSVSYRDGQWNLTAEFLDWEEDHSIIARANFTNAQSSTGWMFLEVQTRESAPDQLQAEAAGMAEGYLTRHSNQF